MRKYNGKELDQMHGLNSYDYGARQYYPTVPIWDRMDPLSEKYYSMSPYAYCGDDPVNAFDPDGREIRIYYKEGNEEKSFLYTRGMKCEVDNAFARACVSALNAVGATEIGGPVLDEVIQSSNKYDFKNLASDAGEKSMQFVASADNKGATINAALVLNDEFGQDDKMRAAGHEIYHGFEQIEGNDPGTINGEVDAYLFEKLLGGAGQFIENSASQQRAIYEKAISNLLLGFDLKNNYETALNNFIDGSRANANGVYNGHKIDSSYKTSILQRIEII